MLKFQILPIGKRVLALSYEGLIIFIAYCSSLPIWFLLYGTITVDYICMLIVLSVWTILCQRVCRMVGAIWHKGRNKGITDSHRLSAGGRPCCLRHPPNADDPSD